MSYFCHFVRFSKADNIISTKCLNLRIMRINNVSKMALSCHRLWGEYESPKIKTVNFQSEGVLCVSVFLEHQEFEFDTIEDL